MTPIQATKDHNKRIFFLLHSVYQWISHVRKVLHHFDNAHLQLFNIKNPVRASHLIFYIIQYL